MFDETLPFALFDDNLDAGGDLLLTGLVEFIQCDRRNEIGTTFNRIEQAREQGLWVALAASYELGLALEPHLAHLLPSDVPLLRAWIFRHGCWQSSAATAEMLSNACAQLAPDEQCSGIAGLTRSIESADYREAVERIRNYIDAGDCYQVNFTFPLIGERTVHALRSTVACATRNPCVMVHSFGILTTPFCRARRSYLSSDRALASPASR